MNAIIKNKDKLYQFSPRVQADLQGRFLQHAIALFSLKEYMTGQRNMHEMRVVIGQCGHYMQDAVTNYSHKNLAQAGFKKLVKGDQLMKNIIQSFADRLDSAQEMFPDHLKTPNYIERKPYVTLSDEEIQELLTSGSL